jgi:hypothetical protein
MSIEWLKFIISPNKKVILEISKIFKYINRIIKQI